MGCSYCHSYFKTDFWRYIYKSIDISKAITLIQNDRVDEASINGDTLFINDVTNSGNVTYKTGIPKQLQDSFYKDYLKDKVESGKLNSLQSAARRKDF